MDNRNLIEQGLELENKIHNAEWEFADWLAVNTTVSARNTNMKKLQPPKRSHTITLSEYAEFSSYSRQYLMVLRNAALVAPPEHRDKAEDPSIALVTDLMKSFQGDYKRVRKELPKQAIAKAAGKKRNYELQTYVQALDSLKAARDFLKRARNIIAIQDRPMSDDGELETAGDRIGDIEDLTQEIAKQLGMN